MKRKYIKIHGCVAARKCQSDGTRSAKRDGECDDGDDVTARVSSCLRGQKGGVEGEKRKSLEQRGIDPRTSRMLSERSTI